MTTKHLMQLSRFIPALIVVYFVGLVTAYSAFIPIFEGSDEAEHFLYVHSILTDDALPVIRSRAEVVTTSTTAAELWNNHTHHAPLYYLLGAVVVGWTERADIEDYLRPNDVIFVRGLRENNPNKWLYSPYPPSGDTARAVYTLRMLNGLLGVVTLGLIYATTYAAWQKRDVACVAMFITASIPSFVAAHAGVNNDALVIMLYSAGVLWLIKTWQAAHISRWQMVFISLIIAGAALAKLTGLSLLGVVVLVLMAGVWRGRFSLRQVVGTVACIVLIVGVLVGWWYVRNLMLYGDFFALSATQSLWGRDFDIATEQASLLDETVRLARSFWLMIGYRHQPLLASDSFLAYGLLLILLGGLGAVYRMARKQHSAIIVICLLVCGVVLLSLVVGTRDVDISYGRILFPALSALMALVALGLWRVAGRWGSLVMVAPLMFFSVGVPAQIATTYPRLAVLTPADAPVEGLMIEDVRFLQSTIATGQALRFELTFAGTHPDNPYLLATAIDSITQERLGHVEVYPGTAATSTLKCDGRYRATVTIPLIHTQAPLSPRLINVALRWSNSSDAPSAYYEGALLIDPRYTASVPLVVYPVRFDDVILLEGYTLQLADESIRLQSWWRSLRPTPDDSWILTVQLLDADGQLVAQTDGWSPAYPSERWMNDVVFIDERVLNIPPQTPPGDYVLMVAWYRLSDLLRLQVTSEATLPDIAVLGVLTYPFDD